MKKTSRIFALLLALVTVLSVFSMVGCDNTNANGSDTETQEEQETKKETPKKETNVSSSSFSNFVGVDWINALDFGFKGDGKTPNDKIFAEYVKYNSSRPIYFPKGVYCFEETLNFHDCMYVKMDPEAELKCIAEEPIDYFITLRGQHINSEGAWVQLLDYAQESYIEGGVINCDYKAKCALGLFQGMHTNYRDFKIINVLEKGIQTLISKTTDGTYNFSNVFIYNTEALPGSYGVYDNGYDNHFKGVSVCNFDTAFYTVGGNFLDCSAWNLDMAVVETSTFAEVYGTQTMFTNVSVDTFRYGFKMTPWTSVSIKNMRWITNKVFYTEELQAQYPRTMFWADEPENVQISLDSLQFGNETNLDFSNNALPKSTFFNVRATNGARPENYKNYRDDLTSLVAVSDKLVALVEDNGSGANLTGASNFDDIKDTGYYNCELRVGKNGVNVPPVKEAGILEVVAVGDKLIQKFSGTASYAQRIFDGTRWGKWAVISGS